MGNMSSIEKLAQTRPKENAGSRSSNRFEYQINWGLDKLLKLEEGNEDYVMIFDYIAVRRKNLRLYFTI